MPIASTTKRLLSAKSTRRRIIGDYSRGSLGDGPIEKQRVRDDLLPRLYSGSHCLPIAGQRVSADDFNSSELLARRGHVDPVAVVHMQDGGGGNHDELIHGLRVEGGRH